MKKHSVIISGHATSLSLEPEFWDMLKKLATEQKKSVADLIQELDQKRTTNLSSTIRVYILNKLTEKIP